MSVQAPPPWIVSLHPAELRAFMGALSVLRFPYRATVTSWYRSPAKNAATPGAAVHSLHLLGLAVDVVTLERAALIVAARSVGLHAIDEGTHVHLDARRG